MRRKFNIIYDILLSCTTGQKEIATLYGNSTDKIFIHTPDFLSIKGEIDSQKRELDSISSMACDTLLFSYNLKLCFNEQWLTNAEEFDKGFWTSTTQSHSFCPFKDSWPELTCKGNNLLDILECLTNLTESKSNIDIINCPELFNLNDENLLKLLTDLRKSRDAFLNFPVIKEDITDVELYGVKGKWVTGRYAENVKIGKV